MSEYRDLITGKPVEEWGLHFLNKPDLRDHLARALSVPQHHTTWDILSAEEKGLFYQQADCALLALGIERREL
jgi:hypothetical protein